MTRNRKGKPFIDLHVKYTEGVNRAVRTFNEEMRDNAPVVAARRFGEDIADLRDRHLHIPFGPALSSAQVLRFYDRNACHKRRAEQIQADMDALLERIKRKF
jgi:hypothetical protein